MIARRRVLALLPALVGGAAVGVAAADATGRRTVAAPAPPPARPTVRAERRDLVRIRRIRARLTHGAATPLPNHLPGVVTWLAPAGHRLVAGEVAWRVADRPVVVVGGEVPAWRPLGPGAEGEDVRQIQRFLADAGHGAPAADGRFGDATARAVRRWQEGLGVPVTGTIDLGAVVATDLPRRVAAHLVDAGFPAAPAVLSVTDVGAVAVGPLEAGDRPLVEVGDEVGVELPDRSLVTGRVGALRPGEPGPDRRAGLELAVTVGEAAQRWVGAPVTVRLERAAERGVLAVPVAALLARSEGGYAVERVVPGGTEMVLVELGASADGWVAVTGGVAEGDELVVGA